MIEAFKVVNLHRITLMWLNQMKLFANVSL